MNRNTQIELDHIYNEDCLIGMKQIPDGTIDLIVTDPPYEFVGNNEKYGGRGAFGSVRCAYHSELEKAGIIGGFQREAILDELLHNRESLVKFLQGASWRYYGHESNEKGKLVKVKIKFE